MKSTIHTALLASAFCLLALPVRADVAPPEAESCVGRAVGAACTLDRAAGTCQNQTCYHYDIGGWNRDASAEPPRTSYTCLECMTATTNNDGDGSPSKDDGGCTMASQSAKRVAPWLLAATFSTLIWIGRRRSR